MSPLNGTYVIINQNRDRPVGLDSVDPETALPVMTSPKKELPTQDFIASRVFHIENIADDRYKISINGEPVGMKSDEDLVWAFGPRVQPASDEWRITHVPQHGKDAYLIETPDKSDGKGWVSSNDDDSQVTIGLLISYRTFPATYPPTEVFEIVHRILDE